MLPKKGRKISLIECASSSRPEYINCNEVHSEHLIWSTDPCFPTPSSGKTDKVCGMLRQWRKKQRVLSPVSFASGAEPPETASTEDEPIDKRLASVTESTGYNWKGGLWEERRKSGLKTSTSALSMKDENQKIAVVTTAALPWMTGTSINPLLRAAFLAKANKQVRMWLPLVKGSWPSHVTVSRKIVCSRLCPKGFARTLCWGHDFVSEWPATVRSVWLTLSLYFC
jgi:hypothetical protein